MEHFFIKQGIKQVVIAALLTLFFALFVCSFLAWLSLIVTLILVYIYRVPFRAHNIIPDYVAPIDGKVEAIDHLNGESIIYVKLSACHGHLIVAPHNGKYELVSRRHGVNLEVDSYKAKRINETALIKFDSMEVELIPGKCNTLFDLEESKAVQQHDRIGVMVEGLAKIKLDPELKTQIKLGDRLYAGETIIA